LGILDFVTGKIINIVSLVVPLGLATQIFSPLDIGPNLKPISYKRPNKKAHYMTIIKGI
jgi:hypothetical protein